MTVIVVAHIHNRIRYSVTVDGRCGWHLCTHNVYESFDDPEEVITSDIGEETKVTK